MVQCSAVQLWAPHHDCRPWARALAARPDRNVPLPPPRPLPFLRSFLGRGPSPSNALGWNQNQPKRSALFIHSLLSSPPFPSLPHSYAAATSKGGMHSLFQVFDGLPNYTSLARLSWDSIILKKTYVVVITKYLHLGQHVILGCEAVCPSTRSYRPDILMHIAKLLGELTRLSTLLFFTKYEAGSL